MKLQLYLVMFVFLFESKHTDGNTYSNKAKSTLVLETNPSSQDEFMHKPLQSHIEDDLELSDRTVPEKFTHDPDDDFTTGMLENEHAIGENALLSSTSKESNSNSHFTFHTKTKPTSEEFSSILGRNSLMQRDQKTFKTSRDKLYAVKRSANSNAKSRISPRGTSRVSSDKYQGQHTYQKDRNMDETVEEGLEKDENGLDNPTKTKRKNETEKAEQKETTETLEHKKSPGTHWHNTPIEPLRHKTPKPTPKHKKLTGTYGHHPDSWTNGHKKHEFVEEGGNKQNRFVPNKHSNGSSRQNNETMKFKNETSKHPFSIKHSTMPVDPNIYNFFQYKPLQSLALLWTKSARLESVRVKERKMLKRMDKPESFESLESESDTDDIDQANLFDWEFDRYDRACLYVENNAYKSQTNSSQVSEEINQMVDNQNEKLARKFLDWQFVNKEDHDTIALKGKGETHPHYLTYKILTITMEIFRDKICKNATPYATSLEVRPFAPTGLPFKAEANEKYLESKLLPRVFIDNLYGLFLTLRDMTLPEHVPNYASKRDEEDIYTDVLENCLKLDPIQWFSHACADQVLAYDDPHNYACTPLVEYDFNVNEYDPILDGIWHMFTAVHSFCFDVFNRKGIRLWHKYSMIVVNSFTEDMRKRWTASIAEPKFYIRLLGPDYRTHLETVNRCMFAATLRSGVPSLLPRFLSVAPTSFLKERIIGKDATESHPAL